MLLSSTGRWPRHTKLQFLGQSVDLDGGVGAHGQETDQRRVRIAFFPGLLQIEDNWLCVLLLERVRDVLSCLENSAVWAPRS